MPKKGSTAIVVYSFSGHSARLAKRLAEDLDAPVTELQAPKYRPGAFGYLRAGFDSLRQAVSKVRVQIPDLSAYERVILVGPVWTSYPALPLRAVLQAQAARPQSVSLFLTCGDHSPPEKAYAIAEKDLGQPLDVTAALANKKEGTAEEEQIVTSFLERFSKGSP